MRASKPKLSQFTSLSLQAQTCLSQTGREAYFHDSPIELGVMSDHQRISLEHHGNPCVIGMLAYYVLIGDTGDDGDFIGNGESWIFEL